MARPTHSGAVSALFPAVWKEGFWEESYSLPWREKTDSGDDWVLLVSWVTIWVFFERLCACVSPRVKKESGLSSFFLRSSHPAVHTTDLTVTFPEHLPKADWRILSYFYWAAEIQRWHSRWWEGGSIAYRPQNTAVGEPQRTQSKSWQPPFLSLTGT